MLIYSYAKLSRAGLGNCLLPWARAVAFARKRHLPILAPRWVQPRLGALIRREAVTRFYLREFTSRGYVRGLNKWLALTLGRRIAEDRITSATAYDETIRPLVFVFEGLCNYFDDIRDDRDVLFAELNRIAASFILTQVRAASSQRFVGVHIRRGDFKAGPSVDVIRARYTPDEWFLAAVDAIRTNSHWGRLPIRVFSDAHETELKAFNSAGCELITTGSTVGDLLLLSRAELLIGSGHSTFTMWASYFGQMPTIYCPGKMQQRVFPRDLKTFEGEWKPGDALPEP